jgi:hypothetical protein
MSRSNVTCVRALASTLAAMFLFTSCVVFDDDPDPSSLACDPPTGAELDATVDDALGWLGRATQADGTYWYEYDRAADAFSSEYHDVRHAGTMMSLYQAAAMGETTALGLGDAGLDYVLAGLATDGDRTAFLGTSRSAELGSTALLIAALVHRRIATDDASHDDLLGSLGRFMDSLRRDDGGMWARATARDLRPIEGQTSTFYTGEAFWAYGLLANQHTDEGWDDAARSVGRYIALDRDDEEGIENPPHPDQWAAYGFAEMRDWGPLDEVQRTYIRLLIDQYRGRLAREIDREAKRVGDGTAPPDESVSQSRGAAFGTTVEALGALWRLSATDPGLADLADVVRGDLVCGAAILAARQNSTEAATNWPRPDVVDGAWFDDDVTRVDDQQHAMSGVLLARDAVAP